MYLPPKLKIKNDTNLSKYFPFIISKTTHYKQNPLSKAKVCEFLQLDRHNH